MYTEVFLEVFKNGFISGFGDRMKDLGNSFKNGYFKMKRTIDISPEDNKVFRTGRTYMNKPIYIVTKKAKDEEEYKKIVGILGRSYSTFTEWAKYRTDAALKEFVKTSPGNEFYKNAKELKQEITLDHVSLYVNGSGTHYDIVFKLDNSELVKKNSGNEFFIIPLIYTENW